MPKPPEPPERIHVAVPSVPPETEDDRRRRLDAEEAAERVLLRYPVEVRP